jgi:hypothetical protein
MVMMVPWRSNHHTRYANANVHVDICFGRRGK